jgi:hypothetical protein
MFATPAAPLRHPAEAELLLRAADGDPVAAGQIVGQLGSGNHWLRQIISEAIQDCAEPRLWQNLLSCLALRRWNAECPGAEPSDGDVESRQRTIAAITELFVKDVGPEHAPATRAKRAVLAAALDDPRPGSRAPPACSASAASSRPGLADRRGPPRRDRMPPARRHRARPPARIPAAARR